MLESIKMHTRQKAIRIHAQPEKAVTCVDSKFGGEFYLPADMQLPASASGEEMEFLAQINFSQMPPLPGFPDKGLLQFFLCTAEEEMEEMEMAAPSSQGHFQVRYFPSIEWKPSDGHNLATHQKQALKGRWPMERLEGAMEFEQAEEMATLSLGEEGIITNLGAEAFVEQLTEDELEEAGYDLSDCADVDRFCMDFGNWGCKAGGYPSVRQGDLRLDEAGFEEYTTLLFQYDLTTQQELEADTFSFLIRPADLAACRFEDILLCWHNCY